MKISWSPNWMRVWLLLRELSAHLTALNRWDGQHLMGMIHGRCRGNAASNWMLSLSLFHQDCHLVLSPKGTLEVVRCCAVLCSAIYFWRVFFSSSGLLFCLVCCCFFSLSSFVNLVPACCFFLSAPLPTHLLFPSDRTYLIITYQAAGILFDVGPLRFCFPPSLSS